jgi:hypothetical protein
MKTKTGATQLSLPEALVPHMAVDVFCDEAGRIGFKFHNRGKRKVWRPSRWTKQLRCSLPRSFAGTIPLGTTDVELTDEDGMLVLDLSAVGKAGAA